MPNDKRRAAKRWAYSAVVEAISGLRMGGWPWEDREYDDLSKRDKETKEEALDEVIWHLSRMVKKQN